MDARLHCSETRAIVEAKCKTIRFDSQRRRCVNMATVQRGCRRRRGDKSEVVPMMKGHMQPRGRSRVTGMLHGSSPARKLHDAWTRRLDGGLLEREGACRCAGIPSAVFTMQCRCLQCPGDCSQSVKSTDERLRALGRSFIQSACCALRLTCELFLLGWAWSALDGAYGLGPSPSFLCSAQFLYLSLIRATDCTSVITETAGRARAVKLLEIISTLQR